MSMKYSENQNVIQKKAIVKRGLFKAEYIFMNLTNRIYLISFYVLKTLRTKRPCSDDDNISANHFIFTLAKIKFLSEIFLSFANAKKTKKTKKNHRHSFNLSYKLVSFAD